MTAGDLARRAGSVERTGARAVAESLSAVTTLARVPVITGAASKPIADRRRESAWPEKATRRGFANAMISTCTSFL